MVRAASMYRVRVDHNVLSAENHLLGGDFDYRGQRDLVFCLHWMPNVVQLDNLLNLHTLESHFRY